MSPFALRNGRGLKVKRTIRFKRSTQPKRRVNKGWIVFLVFVGLLAFFAGFMAVRPVFLLFGIVS